MSFLSSLLSSIGTGLGTVASTVGKGLGTAASNVGKIFTGGGAQTTGPTYNQSYSALADTQPALFQDSYTGQNVPYGTLAKEMNLKPDASNAPTGWGALATEAGKNLLKNIGPPKAKTGVSIGPTANVPGYKKKYASRAPALPAQTDKLTISLEDIQKYGKDYATAKMQRAAAREALVKKYSNEYPQDYYTQSYMQPENPLQWPEAVPGWRETAEDYYQNSYY